MDDPDLFALKKGVPSEEAKELAKKMLPDVYQRIIAVLETYMDTTKENKEILALWIIGTYVHKEFISFPRLFINAMKGSGKSRLLQILKALCWNATVQANLSEAVLFRNACKQTLLFDESEGISNKEKGAMREILNAGYKRGTDVKRMRKSITKGGEQQVVESFDLYGPVALANISGMEDVLGDRCISIILEKSKDPSKTLLLEDFEENPIILDLKFALKTILVYSVGVGHDKQHTMGFSKYNVYTLLTLPTLTTQTTQTTLYHLKPLFLKESIDYNISKEEMEFFNKIHETKIDGRNLEIFFPLFSISRAVSEGSFETLSKIARDYVLERTKQDQLENVDWSFTDFVARQPSSLEYVPVSEIITRFRQFYSSDDLSWLNSMWVGQALKRLQLSLNKRRRGKGVEYILDVSKAMGKLKMFKMGDENEQTKQNNQVPV